MIEDVLAVFDIGRVTSVHQINTGLVNQTFKVTTADGIFVLQSLHTIFPDAALEDMNVVTDYLSSHDLRVPRLIRTKQGDIFIRDQAGLRWRLYAWIEGVVHTSADNVEIVSGAGQIVGQMHRLLKELNYKPQGSIPHFHDTPYILEQLTKVMAELPENAKPLANAVLLETPKVIIDETNLPAQVIHGDLKLSNLLFDERGQAIGVIDFDTLLFRPRAIDMGDALRSWCKQSSEDDQTVSFSRELFEAADLGYMRGLEDNTDNRDLHLQATKQIAYELSARFLTDIVTDNYFGFDATRFASRKAHNFARASGQLSLARSI